MLIVLLVIAGIPYLLIGYQAGQKGMTRSEVINRIINISSDKKDASFEVQNATIGSKIDFIKPSQIGFPFKEQPFISNVATVDLDKDGLLDILVCDCKSNSVNWIRQFPLGVYTETVLTDSLGTPAHV